MNLKDLGWDNYFEKNYSEFEVDCFIPARVASQQKNNYLLFYEGGTINAKLAGKFYFTASKKKQFPTVGDWVVMKVSDDKKQAIVYGILPRKTSFVRKLPISGGRKIKNGIIVGGTTEEQVIASNVDIAFIVCGLDGNFNLQRIERYITLAFNSGASPVIILNKVDCCDNVSDVLGKVQTVSTGIAVHSISVMKNLGMDVFNQYLQTGKTVVFLGSSGVGKSTITNYLLGEERQKTNSTSGTTGKGRHTTTSSELIFHDSGCMIIDTPGLKELQLWCSEDALDESFEDVASIIHTCKYRDCKHDKEPGCGISQALLDGTLSSERLESYMKLSDELERLNERIKQSEQYLSKKEKLHSKIK